MKKIDLRKLNSWYEKHYEERLDERYLPLDRIRPFLEGLDGIFNVSKIGESFQRRDIFKIRFGTGQTKVLLWTQMHGNESTGTRAFLDVLNFFSTPGEFSWLAELILEKCTLFCIPVLNPDGAFAYTRANAQGIDLNRDVISMKAGESKILRNLLKEVDPVYCFNLHDQRTIFSVGPENVPATISFLAPSVDEQRIITEGRKETMRVIASMSELLQQLIPGHIGRYTDEFYPTATGDNFQKMGHHTILIESGHSKGDYQRMISRKATCVGLLQGLRYISSNEETDYRAYFDIPDNEKKYLDIIVKNVLFKGKRTDLGIIFLEKLKEGKIIFEPSIEHIQKLEEFNADEILDGSELKFSSKTDADNWTKNTYNLILFTKK